MNWQRRSSCDGAARCDLGSPRAMIAREISYLTLLLMRSWRMFHQHDDPQEAAGIRVDAIHDARGYRRIRRELARQYDVGYIDPNIEVVDVDLAGDRRLMLRHVVVKGRAAHAREDFPKS